MLARNGQAICQPPHPRVSPVSGAHQWAGDLSTAEAQNDDAPKGQAICQPLTFAGLDARRRAAGHSVTAVIREARLHPKTWSLAKNGGRTRAGTLEKIHAALDALGMHARAVKPDAIRAVANAARLALAACIGRDRRLMAAIAPARRRKRLPHAPDRRRIAQLAIYLTAVELEIGNAVLARALSCSRQNIKQARTRVHDLRDDDPKVDALLDRVAAQLRGEP